jgi:hypothetical protein
VGQRGSRWSPTDSYNAPQALPAAQRHQDPSRHEKKQLLAFLSGVAAEPEQARQLKRYVKWRAAVQEVCSGT